MSQMATAAAGGVKRGDKAGDDRQVRARPAGPVDEVADVKGRPRTRDHRQREQARPLPSVGTGHQGGEGDAGDGRQLEFIHPVVRTTIYADIAPAQRAASHKRAAMLLRRDGVAAAELAPHLMATEPAGDEDVVRCLRAAAGEVRDRGAMRIVPR